MADVFLSYAREDRAFAEKVARALTAMGVETFWDTDIPPGKTWADYIEGKLTGCRAVIVLWSQHSTKSQWVREEARMGRDSSKLIPAIIDGTPAPFGFGEVQAADLSRWNGQSNDPQWTRFAAAVQQAAGVSAVSAPRPSPQPQPVYASASVASAGTESLSPVGYVQKCLRLYANGKGRARRAEYWWWVLASGVAAFVAAVLDSMLFGVSSLGNEPNMQLFSGVLGLAILAPSVAVMSRRFHDVGLSGWLVAGVFGAYAVGGAVAMENDDFGALIIVLTAVAALVVTVLPSKPGANPYGPNPKGL
jgi:uncharacterized membrane protein YhaH (DUF805 family)